MEHTRKLQRLFATINPLIGNGLGSYPLTYRAHQGLSTSVLKSQPIPGDKKRWGVLLEPGSDVYLEQLVDASQPAPWDVRMRYSTSSPTTTPLRLIVCTKTLLQSFECVDSFGRAEQVELDANHDSHLLQLEIDVSSLRRSQTATEGILSCPVSLAIVASGDNPVLLHTIEVFDANGAPVIRNGDLSRGSLYWFFTADDHLVWRTKNAWTYLRIELGWPGILTWALLLVFVLWRALGNRRSGRWQFNSSGSSIAIERERLLIAATILAGWLPMSMLGTLIDTPWIVEFLLLLVAAVAVQFPSETVPDGP